MKTQILINKAGDSLNTGNILYVATTGSDSALARASHVGNPGKPYLTIEAAVGAAVAGDTIYVFSGSYTPVSNIAKSGINMFFEVGTIVTKTTAGSLFDSTGFTDAFNVFGHAEFYKTTTAGYIFYSNSGYAGKPISFECKKVQSNQSIIFYINVACTCYWKVDYATATGDSVMYINLNASGSSFRMDFHTWVSTANHCINTYYFQYTIIQMNGVQLYSTNGWAIGGFHRGTKIHLNVEYISGTAYGTYVGSNIAINNYESADSITVNCNYCSGIWIQSYECSTSLVGAFNYVYYNAPRTSLIGGNIQYLTVGSGHVKTTVTGISPNRATSPSFSVMDGMVDISIGKTEYNLAGSCTGGVTNLYGNTGEGQYYNGYITVNGGTLNILADMVLDSPVNFFEPLLIALASGTLKIKAKITSTLNNAGVPQSWGELIKWSGGNLILDDATLVTNTLSFSAIRATTAGLVARVYSGGFNTNQPALGGPQTGQYFELYYTFGGVALTSIYLGLYITESDIVTYDTVPKLAARMVQLVNASPSVNTSVFAYQDNPNVDAYFRVRSFTKGPAFTYGNGTNLNQYLVKYGSYPFTYIGNGLVNVDSNII